MARFPAAGLSLLLLASIAFAQTDTPKTIRDKLTADDDFDTKLKKSFRKVHSVKLKVGKTYQIELTGDFDTYLRVEDKNKKELAFNDDNGVNLNSRLLFEAPKTTTYRMIVTSYTPKSKGNYTLVIREASKLLTKFQKIKKAHRQAQIKILTKYRQAKNDAEKQKALNEYYELGGKYVPEALSFAMKHKDDPIANDAMRWLVSSLRVGDSLQRRYEKAYQNKKKNAKKLYEEAVGTLEKIQTEFPKYESEMADALFLLKNLSVGKKAPEIDAEDIDGERFKLSEYRGKVVVLDFWGHW